MYALVGIWTMDEAFRDEQDRLIHGELMPLAQAQPGFRSGYWMRDPETGRAHTTMIFDTIESTSRFRIMVESRTRQAAQAGVTSDTLTIVDVVVSAQRAGRRAA